MPFALTWRTPRRGPRSRSRKMSATRRWRLVVEQPLEKSEIAHGRYGAELPPRLAERTLVVEPERSLDQRSNQAQEFLLLRSVASCDEKGSDLNVGDLST